MNRFLILGAFASAAFACATAQNPSTTRTDEGRKAQTSASDSPAKATEEKAPDVDPQNPLIAKWTGPYGGIPPFDQAKLEHFEPAFEAALAESRREIEAIAGDPNPPTFENTVAALDDSGRALRRFATFYGIWAGNISTPEFQKLERTLAPKFAAYSDEITQNERLFKRIEAVYNSPEKAKLTPEQQRLVWLRYTNFVRAGAKLDAEAKKRLSEINQQLARLYTNFSQNVLADEEGYVVVVDKKEDVAGLPESFLAGAAAAARARGHEGKWAFTNTRSSVEPVLMYAQNRALREKVFKNFVNRGDNGDDKDTNKLISQILKLRAERAKLLGYPTHAHWRLENAMAKTPERALQLLESVWKPAVARAKEEIADMQAVADKEGAKFKIAPWDYRFYAEKVRKAKYDLDQNEVKPYMQLEKLREGMFWVAGELFGFDFHAIDDVPVFHPDVRVWEVKDRASGKHVGLWYFDPYARQGKRSGAWMNAYRTQERFRGDVTTIVSNNSNFVKGAPGEPVLISWIDAQTLFHEFGHALHGLASNVTYPSLSGTNVARDFVEFPSQLLEHWLETPEVLSRFAVHYKTGQPIPDALVKKIDKSSTFNQGFGTVEYLSSALIDMKLHLAGDKDIDPDKFERETLAALGMPSEIVMRHRTPHFGHVFGGDGYSAGYYSYLWSDTLTADAFEAFTEGKGAYDPEVAARLRKHVFSVGNTVDPADAYKAFRGREAGTDALMRKRGFAKPRAESSKPVR